MMSRERFHAGMRKDDARKLDHKTLEAMRERAVRRVQDGESPEVVARIFWAVLSAAIRRTAIPTSWFDTVGCMVVISRDDFKRPLSYAQAVRVWFLAVWFVTSQKNGISVLGLQRVLGLCRYETAWTWIHKLRRAMIRPGRDRLTGAVEVDEIYIGSREKSARGRETDTKSIVVAAVEKNGRGVGRIHLRRVEDVSAASLLSFVKDAVRPGTEVHTDGWRAYSRLKHAGYQHL